jgi:hypothetical protein
VQVEPGRPNGGASPHVDAHAALTELAVQFGTFPPFTTRVPQQILPVGHSPCSMPPSGPAEPTQSSAPPPVGHVMAPPSAAFVGASQVPV